MVDIWGFPKIGVPRNDCFLVIFPYKPSILGAPSLMENPEGPGRGFCGGENLHEQMDHKSTWWRTTHGS